ncbi:GNAT family N-acetyltransferase [Plantactinospora sp. WMMB782]|uniref:GNAT family N-acetyltransferase n=1 Tax=Plantactinospora sp. WMMB782 TaxID=3404121 RepID=UPI003B936CC1
MRPIRRKRSGPDTRNSTPLPKNHRGPRDARLDRLVVRPAVHDDLRVIAHSHVALLPVGLFPSLGARFVRRWQRTFLDSRHGLGYVVVDTAAPGDGIVGFLLGTTDQAAHMAALLTDRRTVASLAVAGVGALLCRPRVAARLLRSRAWPWVRQLSRRRAAGAPPNSSRPSPQVAVMIALAVHPEWRGSGLGETLVARFVEDARHAGAGTAELVTPTGPTGAATFYERLGWEAGPYRQTRDGDGLRGYRLHLRDPE